MKNLQTLLILMFCCFLAKAQFPNPAIVGYWENWGNFGGKFIPLKDVNDGYNVIHVSFASHIKGDDFNLEFDPSESGYDDDDFKNEIQQLQSKGKKIFISIGGQNDPTMLDSEEERDIFITSVGAMIDKWNFDGLDIDLEKSSLHFSEININTFGDIRLKYMIDAIKEIMSNYHSSHGKKLLLTMAPETPYVQGGLSDWAVTNVYGGAYLPMIEELNDSIDMINVQLYNSGTMLGLDGKIYAEATPDFVVAMTEAVIRGFTCKGGIGHFSGLPASKVGVGLPGCKGRGYVEPSSLEAAMKYLLGKGPKPGKYELIKKEGYSNLRGMMTWSVNSDNSCSPPNGFVDLYKQLFTNDPYIKIYNPNVITITKENGGEIMVDLFNDNFKTPSETSSWTFTNLPDGVSVGSVTILTDSTAKIILKGNSIQGENQGHIKNLTVIIDSNSLVNSGDEIRKSYGVELTSPGYFIPCRFEAEDFSRMIGAEIRAAEDETNGTKLGGWKNESFVEYDIVVEKSGSYTIEMRVASQNSNGNYSLHLDTNELIKTNIPNTGGWEKWKTISHEVNISKGEYTFRLNRLGGWFGLNWFNFKSDSANGLKRINYSNLTILPNPVENNLTLENVQKGNLSILDLKGAVVKSYSINPQQKIDISTLKKGIYFAIFEDNTGTSYRSKFVKK